MMNVRDRSYGSVVWNKQTCQDMGNLTWFYQYHVCNTKTAASYTTANEGYHYISNLICFSKKKHRRKQGACMYVHLHSDLYNLFFWTKPGALLIHLRRKARWDYKSVWLHGKCDLIISSPISQWSIPLHLYQNFMLIKNRNVSECSSKHCWLPELSELYTDYTICSNYIVLL